MKPLNFVKTIDNLWWRRLEKEFPRMFEKINWLIYNNIENSLAEVVEEHHLSYPNFGMGRHEED